MPSACPVLLSRIHQIRVFNIFGFFIVRRINRGGGYGDVALNGGWAWQMESEFNRIKDVVNTMRRRFPGAEIVTTGHSLGSALAQISAFFFRAAGEPSWQLKEPLVSCALAACVRIVLCYIYSDYDSFPTPVPAPSQYFCLFHLGYEVQAVYSFGGPRVGINPSWIDQYRYVGQATHDVYRVSVSRLNPSVFV